VHPDLVEWKHCVTDTHRRAAAATARSRHVDYLRGRGADVPMGRGGAVTEYRTRSSKENRGNEPPFFREGLAPDRVDAAMHAVQAASPQAMLDGPSAEAKAV
jgi:hypothetical protein